MKSDILSDQFVSKHLNSIFCIYNPYMTKSSFNTNFMYFNKKFNQFSDSKCSKLKLILLISALVNYSILKSKLKDKKIVSENDQNIKDELTTKIVKYIDYKCSFKRK